MLIQFEVGNFLSFQKPVTLSLLASSKVSEYRDTHLISVGRMNLLKSCVLYGANASGKSNVLNAIGFMRQFVINSSKESQIGEPIDVVPFKLDADAENKPCHFEIVFVVEGMRYRYGFEASRERVTREWLFQAQHVAEKELFIRDGDNIELFPAFTEGKGFEIHTRNNVLFLSFIASLNGEISTRIIRWFLNLKFAHGLIERQYASFSANLLKDERYRERMMDLMRKADLGIEDIQVSESPIPAPPPDVLEKYDEAERERITKDRARTKQISLHSVHARFKNGIPLDTVTMEFNREESDGTQKFFHIIGPVLNVLNGGHVLIVDELEAKLHPLLTRMVVQLFNSPVTNPNKAQLVFATHDTNLLHNAGFRRDQVWFTEKTQQQATDLYSLAEIKLPKGKVRKDASYEKDYFRGKYGAIPYLGNFEELIRPKGMK